MLPRADGSYPNSVSLVSTKLIAERFELPASDLTSSLSTPNRQTQLIMQMKGPQIDVKPKANGRQLVLLNFNQPTRQLMWFVTNPQGNIMQRPLSSCSLLLNNIDVLFRGPKSLDGSDENDKAYFRLVSPNMYGSLHRTSGLYQYSFYLQNRYDISGPGAFAKKKPLLYPLNPDWKQGEEGPYFLSEQPNGSFDLSQADQLLEAKLSRPASPPWEYHPRDRRMLQPIPFLQR